MLKLGILDFGVTRSDKKASGVLSDLFEIVPIAESLGYNRYWLAEHHTQDVAWNSADMLIGLLAAITDRIRIGVAGKLLYYNNPLQLAHNYNLINFLFNNRIDLGIARGIILPQNLGRLFLCEEDLLYKSPHLELLAKYEKKIELLVSYLNNDFTSLPDLSNSLIPQWNNHPIDLWVLGSSKTSLPFVLKHQMNFCLSTFHQQNNYIEIIKTFKKQYAEKHKKKINPVVAVAGVCAETSKEANEIFKNHPLKNNLFPFIVGSPDEWKEKLFALEKEIEVEEVVILDMCNSIEEKVECLTLLSKSFSLKDQLQ